MKLINVMASSIDGSISLTSRESDEDRSVYGFSIAEDKEFVRQQIMSADAIITGAHSMRASSGGWQQVGRDDKYPLWAILTQRGLEPHLKFWKQNNLPRVLVSPRQINPDSIVDKAVENWVPKQGEDIARFTYNKLRELGFEKVLLFGGGQINRLFYEAGLVDELNLTLCPYIFGRKGAANFMDAGLTDISRLKLLSSHTVQSHVFLKYQVIK